MATDANDFESLGLSPELTQAVSDKGYTKPTPIQAMAIPVILMGRDVMGCAQTGTGKTAGFTLPMIEILANGRTKARMPRSLVLAPTRELAAQVADNFMTYGKNHKLSMALLIGGETMDEQMRKLDRGVDVLVATPGRMLDLYARGKVLLSDIKILVIDEADRMLDMGFIPDVERIVSLLPPLRQTLFFSATLAPEVKKLAAKFLSNPKEISVAPSASTATTVKQFLIHTQMRGKRELLRHLLRTQDVKNAFIFCNRKRDVSVLVQSLQRHGFQAGELHGDMVQSKRTETLEAFKKDEIKLLVCSDVAARGIDISGVSHVFNFDVPFNAEDYVHRIGRTGRAGNTGVAYTFATKDDDKFISAIVKLVKQPFDILEITPQTDSSAAVSEKPARFQQTPSSTSRRATTRRPDEQGHQDNKKKKRESDRKCSHRHDQDSINENDDAVGFGDHLPAFMQ